MSEDKPSMKIEKHLSGSESVNKMFTTAQESFHSSRHVTRVRVVNLIVFSDGEETAEESQNTVAETFNNIPLRAIFITHIQESKDTGFSTDTSSFCQADNKGKRHICAEQVFLTAQGKVLKHLPNTVFPLLVPDLPTYIWWRGRPHSEEKFFEELLAIADVVMLNSSEFPSDYSSLSSLQKLFTNQVHPGIIDINWLCLNDWRIEIASFFDKQENLKNIDNIQSIKIHHRGKNIFRPLLLLGWISSLLKWRVIESKKTKSGLICLFKNVKSCMEIKGEVILEDYHAGKENIIDVQLEIVAGSVKARENTHSQENKEEAFTYSFQTKSHPPKESEIIFSQIQNLSSDLVFLGALNYACKMVSQGVLKTN